MLRILTENTDKPENVEDWPQPSLLNNDQAIHHGFANSQISRKQYMALFKGVEPKLDPLTDTTDIDQTSLSNDEGKRLPGDPDSIVVTTTTTSSAANKARKQRRQTNSKNKDRKVLKKVIRNFVLHRQKKINKRKSLPKRKKRNTSASRRSTRKRVILTQR